MPSSKVSSTNPQKARLDELEAAKDELENMIACEKLAKPKITEEQMMFWLHRFRKLDVSKKEHRQMLIDTFVNAIYLYDDKMLITFNYKDGTKTITFDEATTALANKDTGSNLDCLCVWLSRTGLEAGETKRSCGAFCPAGERKQSGRAARSASKGRLERRVPPPAPNQYNPNQIFLIGDGFGLFVFFEKFEDTHFRNGVVKRPESKIKSTEKNCEQLNEKQARHPMR